MTRFLGDSPLRVVLVLIIISFLVGLVMSALGWSPFDVIDGIRDFFLDIWNMGFSALERFLLRHAAPAHIKIVNDLSGCFTPAKAEGQTHRQGK